MSAFEEPTAQFSLLDIFSTDPDSGRHAQRRHRRPLSDRQRSIRVIIGFAIGVVILVACTKALPHVTHFLPI